MPCHLWYFHTLVTLHGCALIADNLTTSSNGSWELDLYTTPLSGPGNSTLTPIWFLPNGSVDSGLTIESDISFANGILSGAKNALYVQTNVTVDNMLELINWIFVSIYWTMLMDFGQTAPVGLNYSLNSFGVPTPFHTTNNIFTNVALFNIYYAYLNKTILPLIGATNPSLPQVQPISASDISNSSTKCSRSYSCTKRQWRTWIEAIVAIILADYALVGFPYTIVAWLVVRIQRRGRRDCNGLVYDAHSREPLRGVFGKS
jgi:hypothetical protein